MIASCLVMDSSLPDVKKMFWITQISLIVMISKTIVMKYIGDIFYEFT